MKIRVWLLIAAAVWAVGCNRNMEPFDPSEEPREPDLSKIFPAGAQPPPNQAGLPPSPGGDRAAPPVAPATGGTISGVVVISSELSDQVSEGGVLFVIARTGAAGPPTAVKKVSAPKFPLQFSIGPDDRMVKAMPFAGPLTLTARFDGDGNAATREAGDLQGTLNGTVEPGVRGLILTLDELL